MASIASVSSPGSTSSSSSSRSSRRVVLSSMPRRRSRIWSRSSSVSTRCPVATVAGRDVSDIAMPASPPWVSWLHGRRRHACVGGQRRHAFAFLARRFSSTVLPVCWFCLDLATCASSGARGRAAAHLLERTRGELVRGGRGCTDEQRPPAGGAQHGWNGRAVPLPTMSAGGGSAALRQPGGGAHRGDHSHVPRNGNLRPSPSRSTPTIGAFDTNDRHHLWKNGIHRYGRYHKPATQKDPP